MFIISFSGHRPHKLQNLGDVRSAIRKFLLEQQELHPDLTVCSGGALGVDQFAAEISDELRIPFVLALPFPVDVMTAKWRTADREHLRTLISKAVKTFVVQKIFSMSGYQRRNEFMVDHCKILCAFWDGSRGGTANCVKYAQTQGVPVKNLLSDIFSPIQRGDKNE